MDTPLLLRQTRAVVVKPEERRQPPLASCHHLLLDPDGVLHHALHLLLESGTTELPHLHFQDVGVMLGLVNPAVKM